MKHITSTLALAALLVSCQNVPQPKSDYSWEQDLKMRQLIEYRQTFEEVKEGIKEYIPDVTDEQIAQWEKDRSLECIEIDGEKHYFKYAVSNLFRIDSACIAIKKAKQQNNGSEEPSEVDKNIDEVMAAAPAAEGHLAAPKKMRIRFTLAVDSGAVPVGKTIRCWLPFPRADVDRQSDVRLVETSEKKYEMSDPSCVHSTVYMEKKAEAGKTVFSEVFEYTASGSWFNPQPENALPYDTTTENYKKYTAEREKHVVFTPELKELAAKLTAGETNPVIKAKKIFEYIDKTIPWASSCDYSIMENIPMYVYTNRHGDCGMQSLLFITLCRISGIPARWQSGLVVPPDNGAGMHDWGEAYFEGIGWVPIDQSRGLNHEAATEDLKWFNFGGMDSWRLVFNSDYGMEFSPKKTYPRSDTVDLQRGEVEWEGGNLYFNQWSWDVDIEYLD